MFTLEAEMFLILSLFFRGFFINYLGRIWGILAKNSCGGSGIQVQ